VTARTKSPKQAQALIDFLTGKDAQAARSRAGFVG
jgi:ABC-type Fe3+ transport system substrate-binding protein